MKFFDTKKSRTKLVLTAICTILASLMLVTPAFAQAVRINLPWLSVALGEDRGTGNGGTAYISDSGELVVYYNNGYFYPTSADAKNNTNVLTKFAHTSGEIIDSTFWDSVGIQNNKSAVGCTIYGGGVWIKYGTSISSVLSKTKPTIQDLSAICGIYNSDIGAGGYWCGGLGYYYDGTNWIQSQKFTTDMTVKDTRYITKLTVYLLSEYESKYEYRVVTNKNYIYDDDASSGNYSDYETGENIRNCSANTSIEINIVRYSSYTNGALISASEPIYLGNGSDVVKIDNKKVTDYPAIKASSGSSVVINSTGVSFAGSGNAIQLDKSSSSTAPSVTKNVASFPWSSALKVSLTGDYWQGGDVVVASGNNHVDDTDMNLFDFGTIPNSLTATFNSSAFTIKLAGANISDGTNWYGNITDAINSGVTSGSTLIWYKDTTDASAINISGKDLTIRNATSEEASKAGITYSATHTATINGGLTIADGASLTIGGGLAICGTGTITNNGTLTYAGNSTIANTISLPSGKTIAISSSTVNTTFNVSLDDTSNTVTTVATTTSSTDITDKFTLANTGLTSPAFKMNGNEVVLVHGKCTVYKSNDGSNTEVAFNTLDIVNGNVQIDLTSYVPDDYLYGGYNVGTSYDSATLAKTAGIALNPTNGANYCVKCVADTYLGVKSLAQYHKTTTAVTGYYMLSVVDSLDYDICGFYVKVNSIEPTAKENTKYLCKNNGITVYNSIKVSSTKTLSPSGILSGVSDDGYIMAVNLAVADGSSYSFVPYWKTADGVTVYGKTARVFSKTEGSKITYLTPDTNTSHGDIKLIDVSSKISDTAVYSDYTDNSSSAVYVLTKYEQGNVYYQQMTYGDNTSNITHKEIPGSTFIGWYSDENYENVADFTEISADMEVYARYIEDEDLQYTLTANGDGTYSVLVILPEDIDSLGEVSIVMTVGDKEIILPADKLTELQTVINKLFSAMNGKDYNLGVYTATLDTSEISGGSAISINVRWTSADNMVYDSNPIKYRYLFRKLWRV